MVMEVVKVTMRQFERLMVVVIMWTGGVDGAIS